MAGIGDIYAAINSAAQAISRLTLAVNAVFPQVTGSSSFITNTGTVTFLSSEPIGFITVVTSSGVTVKIPYWT